MPLKRIFETTGPIAGRLGDMTKDEAVRLGIALCFAVGRLPNTAQGHGRIWPGVIRIGPEETVIVDPPHPEAEPSANELEYAAPEHFWNGICSPAGDVYSIGLVIYAALNHGRLPFIPAEGEITPNDRAEAMKHRMKGDVPIPFPAAADDSLRDILGRALAFEPEIRWKSPMDLHNALCNCAADAAAGVLLPGSGVSLFGKNESDMTEVERMMSEILERIAADRAATLEEDTALSGTESEEASKEVGTPTDKDTPLPAGLDEQAAEASSDEAEPEPEALLTEMEPAAEELESVFEKPEKVDEDAAVSSEEPAPVENFQASADPLSVLSADSTPAEAATALTGLAALAEELEGKPPAKEPAAVDTAAEPEEAPDHGEAASELESEEMETDAEAVSDEGTFVPYPSPPAMPEQDAYFQNKASAEADADNTPNLPEANETPRRPLDMEAVLEQVDSQLDSLSNSLFEQPDPTAAEKEAERRRRIAEALEAQEKADKRKKRKRRSAVTAIVLMLVTALGALLLLAHSFGFEGFSLSQLGDAFYDTVFSKIFSDNKDKDTPEEDKTDKKDDDSPAGQEPERANKSDQDSTDKTDNPDQNSEDPTATDTPNQADPNDSTQDTPNPDSTVTPPSNPPTPTTGNSSNPPTSSVTTGTVGTSGTGTPVTPDSSNPGSASYHPVVADFTWQQAELAAREGGGHLITIADEAELEQVIALAESLGVSYVWLGAYRNESGNWVWVTGEPFDYAPWNSGEPSGTDKDGTAENYLILSKVVRDGVTKWVYNDVCNDPFSVSPKRYPGNTAYLIEYDA